jgi:hypothetical protein
MNNLEIVRNTLGANNEDVSFCSDESINDEEIETGECFFWKKNDSEIIKIYNFTKIISISILHTFLLSIFETLFFWIYISKQERNALIRNLDKVKIFIDILCINFESHNGNENLDMYVKDTIKKRKVSNLVPFKISIILVILLLLITIISNIVTLKIGNLLKKRKISYDINITFSSFIKYLSNELKLSIPLFIFISIYEFLFFQLVIYYYQPMSSDEVVMKLISSCI